METKLFALKDGIGFASMVDRMQNDFALKVVNSARISFDNQKDSFDDSDKKLVSYLWGNGHTSPFRHSCYTFHVKCPLFVFRQWTKYQVASTWRKYELDGDPVPVDVFDLFYDTDKGCSWNEISGRYAKLTPEFYIPARIRGNTKTGSKQKSEDLGDSFNHWETRIHMQKLCEEAYNNYLDLLEIGVAKEIARTILPQSIYTEAYWTVSLQGVLHFLQQRLAPDAQYEIRMYAEAIYELIKDDLEKLGLAKEAIIGCES